MLKKFSSEYFAKNHPLSLQQEMSFHLLLTASWVTRRYTKLLKSYGISLPQYYLLRILYHEYPKRLSIKVLTQRMIDSNSNASRLMDKLCKGLALRELNDQDRRQVDASLTEQGYELVRALSQPVDDLFAGADLSGLEIERICVLLGRLRERG